MNRTRLWPVNTTDANNQPCTIYIKLQVDTGVCFMPTPQLYIDDRPMPSNISGCTCTPICGSGGEHKFEAHGHTFQIVYNPWIPAFNPSYRLFVDNRDYHTNLSKRYYFMRTFLIMLLVGLLVFTPTFFVFIFAIATSWSPYTILVDSFFMVLGFFYSVIGLVGSISSCLREESSYASPPPPPSLSSSLLPSLPSSLPSYASCKNMTEDPPPPYDSSEAAKLI